MKKLLVMTGVLLALAAPMAGAAGLNLNWNDCTLGGGVANLNDACTAQFGTPYTLICSTDPPNMPNFVAAAGIVSLQVQPDLGLWWRYEFPLLELRIDGQPRQATQIAVANIAEYGGSFRLVPKGMWDDHQLDVVLFHGRGRRAMLSFYVDIVRGVHAQRPDVEILPATNVDLLGPMGSAVQIDGDVVSEPLPLSVRLARARLRVLQPET